MVRRSAVVSHRRRFLSGFAATGLALVMAGCERPSLIPPTPLTVSPTRKAQPTPLEPVTPPDLPAVPIDAVFAKVVRLEGVTIERESVRSGDYLRIWLYWQSIASGQEDLRSSGQLVTDGGRVLANEDDQIGRRRRFLSRWEVGERSIDEMRIRIAPSVEPGEYGLAVSVLRPDNQTRAALTSRLPAASIWNEDGVLIGTIEVVTG